ncbi:fungal specific transcription factor domain-containing protein [Sarocladium implicatum]|nr:fungal specific transcription factor domain-containing protein [Sarocladium implicatum]
MSFLNLTSGEWETFEWFERRTIPKLPAAFQSRYWTTLLSQASVSEPAVLHAILAVGSVHRASVIAEGRTNIISASSTSRLTKDGLHHYVEALSQLRTHTVVRDINTLRIILTSCIAFASLELLRGHTESARGHILHGMRLMRENGWLTAKNEPTLIVTEASNSTEKWITDALRRLHLQMLIYDTIFLNKVDSSMVWPERRPIPPIIRQYNLAWATLERLMLQGLWISNMAKLCKVRGIPPRSHFPLIERYAVLKADLNAWYKAYKAGETMVAKGGPQKAKDLTELDLNYCLTLLLSETAMAKEEEMDSPAMTEMFAEPLRLIHRLWHELMLYEGIRKIWSPLGFCHSILDMGAIHIAYFIAVHCRAPHLKVQAITFANLMQHNESFWDGHIVSIVADRIVKTEVGAANYDKLSKLSTEDLLLKERMATSEEKCTQRLQDPTIAVIGEPPESAAVFYTVSSAGLVEVQKLGEYNVPLAQWTD